MQTPLGIDETIGPPYVSTGHLPPAERADILLAEAYGRFKINHGGKVADYIPALARTPRTRSGYAWSRLMARSTPPGTQSIGFRYRASPSLLFSHSSVKRSAPSRRASELASTARGCPSTR